MGGSHQSGLRPTLFFGGGKLAHERQSEAVRRIAERVAIARGLELVDVELARDRGGFKLRVFVDAEGGIGVDGLQAVSEEVSAILDAEDPIEASYTLEVSSPGLDRPLRSEADYRRFKGRLARISSYEPVEGRRHWTGRLVGLESGLVSLSLEQEGGRLTQIPFAKIAHGRLEVEFPR